MNSAFWRYVFILSLLFIFWSEFFDSSGVLNQLAFNFALFYPLGFLVGYRPHQENSRSAYTAAVAFNLFSYLLVALSGIPFVSWTMVLVDFTSLFLMLQVGMIVGKHVQVKE